MNQPRPRRSRLFWGGLIVGWAMIGYGVRGVFVDSAATRPTDLARWVVGAALVHDALIAPLAFGIGWLVTRALPRRIANPVKAGLGASAVLIVFSWGLVRGYGRRATVPSALPLDYGRNLVLGLAVIWIVVVAVVATASIRTRTRAKTTA